jgi:hypothetical protein
MLPLITVLAQYRTPSRSLGFIRAHFRCHTGEIFQLLREKISRDPRRKFGGELSIYAMWEISE